MSTTPSWADHLPASSGPLARWKRLAVAAIVVGAFVALAGSALLVFSGDPRETVIVVNQSMSPMIVKVDGRSVLVPRGDVGIAVETIGFYKGAEITVMDATDCTRMASRADFTTGPILVTIGLDRSVTMAVTDRIWNVPHFADDDRCSVTDE